MAVIVAIIIFVVVLLYLSRRQRGVGPALGGPGRTRQKTCEWELVDPNTERALKEYRCVRCNNIAYGRGNNLPAARICRTS